MTKDQNNPIDMDLIRRVQQARIQHDADATPSQVGSVYWIEARREVAGPEPTPRAGYFVVETTMSEVDRLWALVRDATNNGRLGYKSKVSTSARSGHPDQRLIHVVTYDADDRADVARVADALRDLGLQPSGYHRDAP